MKFFTEHFAKTVFMGTFIFAFTGSLTMMMFLVVIACSAFMSVGYAAIIHAIDESGDTSNDTDVIDLYTPIWTVQSAVDADKRLDKMWDDQYQETEMFIKWMDTRIDSTQIWSA